MLQHSLGNQRRDKMLHYLSWQILDITFMKTSLEGLIVVKSDKLKDRHDAQYLNTWLRQRNLDFRQTWLLANLQSLLWLKTLLDCILLLIHKWTKKIKGRFDNVFDSLKRLIKSFNYLIQENLLFSNTLKILIFAWSRWVLDQTLGYKLPELILPLSFLGDFRSLRHKWCISSTDEFLENFLKLGCRGHWCDQT